jgi:hypothetical protein
MPTAFPTASPDVPPEEEPTVLRDRFRLDWKQQALLNDADAENG